MSDKTKITQTVVYTKPIGERVLILTTQKGYEDFKHFVHTLDILEDVSIVFTDRTDYIISLSKTLLIDLVTISVKKPDSYKLHTIPQIFYDLYFMNYGNLTTVCQIYGAALDKIKHIKYYNAEYYEILTDYDKQNIDDEDALIHTKIHITMVVNRLCADYVSRHFVGYELSWKRMDNMFIKPRGASTEDWLKLCKQAWKTWSYSGHSETLSRLILPACIAYEIDIECELMKVYHFCKCIIEDPSMLEYDDMVDMAKGLSKVLSEFDISMLKEMLGDFNAIIKEYDLPF
jgi:hypothetical protein